jgi:hypothetical protein
VNINIWIDQLDHILEIEQLAGELMRKWVLGMIALVIGTSLMLGWPFSQPALQQLIMAAPLDEPSGTQPAPSMAPQSPGPSSLEDAVTYWKDSLATNKTYASWKNATWVSYPLGPGTHGWVIVLKRGGAEIGYMIIHMTEEGSYRLTEYGNGSMPLFSLNTLYNTLMQNELIRTSFTAFAEQPSLHGQRLYLGPLEAVWKVTIASQTHIVDAKTGELLPIQAAALSEYSLPEDAYKKSGTLSDSSHILTDKLELPAFDPYSRLPWVKGSPLPIQSFAEAANAIRKDKLTYVVHPFSYELTVPLAVTGFHQWTSSFYLLLDQNGQRAVAYDALPSSGHFYR